MDKNYLFCLLLAISLLPACNSGGDGQASGSNSPDTSAQVPHRQNAFTPDVGDKLIIYQMMTRLFGNKKTSNAFNGTLEQNGVGKFADINQAALKGIAELGATHLWYTGVIEHATMLDFSDLGIPPGDADVIKGRAGSPYAIVDYYDVNPYLAESPPQRMEEFEALLARTHAAGMGVILDFVPNHVARGYHSNAMPEGTVGLGEQDDPSLSFDPDNNFYYLPGKTFKVPPEYDPLGPGEKAPGEDGAFAEKPAKVTGNNVFSESPGKDDWFETVKLNYGVDYQKENTPHFKAKPATWLQMRDILLYWAAKGVDGFRCDMAEMVPVEFWEWVIPEVKQARAGILFIAEIYNPAAYHDYVRQGHFDYLYDKVGVYDRIRELMSGGGSVEALLQSLEQSAGIEGNMLRFLENHDEQRIASPDFAGDARAGLPGMVVSATLGEGPVMVYFGQECGEPGRGAEGFQGEDGRTTIFDFWAVPEHQKWMNGGKFDGGGLSEAQRELRNFYAKLFKFCKGSLAVREGEFIPVECPDDKVLAFLRVYRDQEKEEKLLIIANFAREGQAECSLTLSSAALQALRIEAGEELSLEDALEGGQLKLKANALNFSLKAWEAHIYRVNSDF